MRAVVNSDTCIGCGICIQTAPSVFSLADTGKAVAVKQEVQSSEQVPTQLARDTCPTDAIDIS